MDEPQDALLASASASPPPSPSHAAKSTFYLKLLLLLLSKVPLLTQVAILHILKLSEPAKYIDLQSNLVVSFIRSVLTPANPRPLSFAQKLTTRNKEVKGRIWISLYASPPPPETDIRDSLMETLENMRDLTSMGEESESGTRVPSFTNVEAEWTGYRALASANEPLPAISESAKYVEMMKECQEPTTVLYFHGGAYYLCDPATHRSTVKKLAKLTGGRCYSVRYRLAPQDPFPSALLDALVSYFTLLYPPPDAYHEAVKPEHIVIAGDRYVFKKKSILGHGELCCATCKKSLRLANPDAFYLGGTAPVGILPSRYCSLFFSCAVVTLASSGTASSAQFLCRRVFRVSLLGLTSRTVHPLGRAMNRIRLTTCPSRIPLIWPRSPRATSGLRILRERTYMQMMILLRIRWQHSS